MLLLAARVGEAKINELDVLVLDHFQYVGGCSHGFSLGWGEAVELLRRSGVFRSASKSRNYAISGRPWHRVEQGFAGLDGPIAGVAAPNRFPPGFACHRMVRRERRRLVLGRKGPSALYFSDAPDQFPLPRARTLPLPADTPHRARRPRAMSDAAESVLAAGHRRAADASLPYFGAVTPAEAMALLESEPAARLIDVRTRAEWDYVGRVPGSALIEWNTYPDGTRNQEFVDELRRTVGETDAPVLFLCRSGHRSDSAARAAAAAGYTRAFNVLEGFEGNKDADGHRGNLGGWRKAGLPWVQG
jgi:rhodanese-related sulfurtransferase